MSISITPSESFSFIGGGTDNIAIGSYSGTITSGSSNIAVGSSNIAYGTMGSVVIGSYPTESYGTVTTNPIWSSGSLYVKDNSQEEKINKLETRIKDLESKLEMLMDAIDTDKMVFKVTI